MNLKMNRQKLTLKSKQFQLEDLASTESSFNTNESNHKKSINEPTQSFCKAEKMMTKCLMTLKCKESKSKPLIEKQQSLHGGVQHQTCPLVTNDDCCFKSNRKGSQKVSEENEKKFKTGLCKNFETTGECVFGASVDSLVFFRSWKPWVEVEVVCSLFFQNQNLQTVFGKTLLLVWCKVPVLPWLLVLRGQAESEFVCHRHDDGKRGKDRPCQNHSSVSEGAQQTVRFRKTHQWNGN